MKRIGFKYRLIAAFLLTIIVSHIALFHFDLGGKVVCVHNNGVSHFDDVNKSHSTDYALTNAHLSDLFGADECRDFILDRHIDENIVRIKVIAQRVNKLIAVLNGVLSNGNLHTQNIVSAKAISNYVHFIKLSTTTLLI